MTVIDVAIALRANAAAAVPETLKSISAFGETPAVDNETTRLELLARARDLVRALETPRETMVKHCWAQPGCFTAITSCYNLGVFPVLAAGDGRPKNVSEIANTLKTNPKVLARLMKHIAAMGYITETGSNEYAPTNFSKALTFPHIGDGYPCLTGGCLESVSKFPAYMEMTNYASPTDISAGPYQYAFNTKMNMMEYLSAHPPLGMQFHRHMGGYRQGRPSWMDANFYPVQERLVEGFEPSGDPALLVDIGGSLGHDLQEFVTKYPDAPGRLVLQDLPIIINAITDLNPKIERMCYDFYNEQPVKGARAYYLHSVLHDWPDAVGKTILKNIAAAMKPGYSRILLNENIIPDKGADWQATALDVMMITLFSSKERTLSDWKELLEDPALGLKIVGIWNAEGSTESLIECMLA